MPADLPPIEWPLVQRAVWWNYLGNDEFSKPLFASPLEIACRWDEDEQEIMLPGGIRYLTKAQVLVDRRLKVNDALKRCLLTELSPTALLLPYKQGAFKVEEFSVVPDSEAEEAVYTAYL